MARKPFFRWLAVLAVVMLTLPWLAVNIVPGDAGMAACFVLFYAVNPLCCVGVGWFAGKDVRSRWSLPALAAALFLAGVWMLFDAGEPAFFRYATAYLALGIGAMLLSLLAARIGKRAQQHTEDAP